VTGISATTDTFFTWMVSVPAGMIKVLSKRSVCPHSLVGTPLRFQVSDGTKDSEDALLPTVGPGSVFLFSPPQYTHAHEEE
jgi:hypothetical protein